MRSKRIGKRTVVTFNYLEWVGAGKAIPPLPEDVDVNSKIEYVIDEVPEDKKEYFESLGLRVRLVVSKGKGMRKW